MHIYFFVLLVKKIILDKYFFSDWWVTEKEWKNVKFISFWPLSIWASVHSLQSHCCADQFDLYIFPKHGCNITVAFFNMHWYQGKRGSPVISSPQTTKNFIEQVHQDDSLEYRRPFNSGRIDGGQKAVFFPGDHGSKCCCTLQRRISFSSMFGVFSLTLLRGSSYSLHVTCESQLASTGAKQKYTSFSSKF